MFINHQLKYIFATNFNEHRTFIFTLKWMIQKRVFFILLLLIKKLVVSIYGPTIKKSKMYHRIRFRTIDKILVRNYKIQFSLFDFISHNTKWKCEVHYQITWQIHYHKHKKCQSSVFVLWPDNNKYDWLWDGTLDYNWHVRSLFLHP